MKRSKRDEVLELLRRELASGRYPAESLLPSENELREQWGISRNTIREAVSVLVQEGLVERRRGSGTRVVATESTLRSCLLIVRTTGDLYERQAQDLQRYLQERGVIPMILPLPDDGEAAIIDLRSGLRYASAHRMDGLIVHGLPNEVREFLTTARSTLSTVIVNEGVSDLPHAVNQIVADHFRGARLATHHLRKLGHERILAVIHRYNFLSPGRAIHQARGVYGDLIRGYIEGLDGESPHYHFIDREFLDSQDVEGLRRQLRGPRRPTAIFAVGDYRAKAVIDIAGQLGLRVPEELAVVGYGNTPWATLGQLPLTTIEHHYERIAELAVEQLFPSQAPEFSPTTRIVEPELVVRTSCGARIVPSSFSSRRIRQA